MPFPERLEAPGGWTAITFHSRRGRHLSGQICPQGGGAGILHPSRSPFPQVVVRPWLARLAFPSEGLLCESSLLLVKRAVERLLDLPSLPVAHLCFSQAIGETLVDS